jgi:hypothetical protein
MMGRTRRIPYGTGFSRRNQNIGRKSRAATGDRWHRTRMDHIRTAPIQLASSTGRKTGGTGTLLWCQGLGGKRRGVQGGQEM